MSIPTTPAYQNDAGQDIYFIGGANHSPRGTNPLRYLVLHHTAGTDSRAYLRENALGVSCHYLIGLYPNAGINPRIYKFASESTQQTYTQGYSTIGTTSNMNPFSVSIEIEGPPIDSNVLDEAATLAASILRYWYERGVDLLLIGHKHVDRQSKIDPATPWTALCKTIYGRV